MEFHPDIRTDAQGRLVIDASNFAWTQLSGYDDRIDIELTGDDLFTGLPLDGKKTLAEVLAGDKAVLSNAKKRLVTEKAVALYGEYTLSFYAVKDKVRSKEPLCEETISFKNKAAVPELKLMFDKRSRRGKTVIKLEGEAVQYLGSRLWANYEGRYFRLHVPGGAKRVEFCLPTTGPVRVFDKAGIYEERKI